SKTREQETSREAEKERKRQEAAKRNQEYRERRKHEKRLERIERKMKPLEARRDEIETLFSDPGVVSDSSRLVELQKEHSYLSDQLASLEEQWIEIADST
ncbi:MAG TPA: hypothetical protein PK907_06165, partial [Candidatus Sabulitectum sp.]|nr:hypothetical protein [Candidatus Sabulitectum sp.]